MSIRVEHRIGVSASPARIWEVLADLEHWGSWNPMYPEASGKIALGATLHLLERLEGRPDRRIEATVLDWTPETQLILRIKEGAFARRMQYFEIDALAGKDASGCIFAAGVYFEGWNENGAARRLGRPMRHGFGQLTEALKAKVETP